MQTNFSPAALEDPQTAQAERAIRKCVHCGFCTATCPTYVLLGDELDSPRGRIYLMKDMLEAQKQPTAEVVKHVDRCLTCLSCTTTCPSGVDYQHLVDHARSYIEQRYKRPLADRAIRALLAAVLPYPGRFRTALALGRLGRPFRSLFVRGRALSPLAAMLDLVPSRVPAGRPVVSDPMAGAGGRVLLVQGCAEPVLKPHIREATVRLLNRIGYAVVFAAGENCCGALVRHMGRETSSLAAARANIDAWDREIENGGLDAILITASGCGTTVKDYGHMFENDPEYAEKARRVSGRVKDISEFLATAGLPAGRADGMVVAYHPACSLQHGQKITEAPKALLAAAGFTVKLPAEAHLCCGSAGVYNILQADIAAALGDRKVAAIEKLAPECIATGNIGCAVQIGGRTSTPVVHTVELLDWATGGPVPPAIQIQRGTRA